MSRYFNDFGAMHGESLEHKAYKYIKKVKTKSGKTRYVYAKTVGSVAKNIASNPRKYGSAHMEELTPEELRRFRGKAHMDKLEMDDVGYLYNNMGKAVKHPDGDIMVYDKKYDVGRSGTRVTLSRKNGNLTKDGYLSDKGRDALHDTNLNLGAQYSQEEFAKLRKRALKKAKEIEKRNAKAKKKKKRSK
jgi:hypothetical protein